jgi:hypothetical protein
MNMTNEISSHQGDFPDCVAFFCAIHAVSTEIYLSDGSSILATVTSDVEDFGVRHIRSRK